jgi:uncharacterized protein HemY
MKYFIYLYFFLLVAPAICYFTGKIFKGKTYLKIENIICTTSIIFFISFMVIGIITGYLIELAKIYHVIFIR